MAGVSDARDIPMTTHNIDRDVNPYTREIRWSVNRSEMFVCAALSACVRDASRVQWSLSATCVARLENGTSTLWVLMGCGEILHPRVEP